MLGRRLLLPATLAALAAVAIPTGVVSANANQVTATCEAGLSFNMDRGEAGTRVTVHVDNAPSPTVDVTVAAQNDPVRFTVPNPDRNRVHTFTVVVDSVYNADQRIIRTIDACPAATTTSSTTTTTVPAPSTTVPAAPTSSTPTGSTVVTTPRTPGTSTTTLPPAVPDTSPSLPSTGGDPADTAVLAAGVLAAGVAAAAAARRRVRAS